MPRMGACATRCPKMDGGIGGLNVEREEFSNSKFDLFAKTEYEVGVKKCISQTFRPLTTSSSHGPFSFLIPSDPEKFTNVESLRLHGRMRIMKRSPTTGGGRYKVPVLVKILSPFLPIPPNSSPFIPIHPHSSSSLLLTSSSPPPHHPHTTTTVLLTTKVLEGSRRF